MRCTDHKLEDDISVVDRLCIYPGCSKTCRFALPGERPRRCHTHRTEGDVNVVEKTCVFPGCQTRASFAQPGEKRARCSSHRIDGDFSVNRKHSVRRMEGGICAIKKASTSSGLSCRVVREDGGGDRDRVSPSNKFYMHIDVERREAVTGRPKYDHIYSSVINHCALPVIIRHVI
jgi:hypothetical protein